MGDDFLFEEVLTAGWHVHPAVVVVGDISRTWYADRDLMAEILEQLWGVEPNVSLFCRGAPGFDFHLQEWCTELGVRCLTLGDTDVWVESAWMVLVLTRRKIPKEVWEIDPEAVEAALECEVPVFSVDEDGKVKAWP